MKGGWESGMMCGGRLIGGLTLYFFHCFEDFKRLGVAYTNFYYERDTKNIDCYCYIYVYLYWVRPRPHPSVHQPSRSRTRQALSASYCTMGESLQHAASHRYVKNTTATIAAATMIDSRLFNLARILNSAHWKRGWVKGQTCSNLSALSCTVSFSKWPKEGLRSHQISLFLTNLSLHVKASR